uniref:ATP synthase CF0 subunit epsilon n=1 Tax=Euglena agilis TaxID=96764 RepID=UPI0023AB04B4|nr:ATP synthase CF0 subunit epsilon [Euglena agilis]WCH63292.1 ATP synthase CF0 subunit epsilon [Euglena agilis]
MTLEISIKLVPDKIFWKNSVKEVILPTLSGQMGILTNHIPVLTGLDTGLLLVRDASSSNWVTFVVTGGFALVNENKITILVNEAEFGSDVNVQEAEEAYLASKVALESNSDVTRKFELNSQFKKARARFQLVQSSKNIG